MVVSMEDRWGDISRFDGLEHVSFIPQRMYLPRNEVLKS